MNQTPAPTQITPDDFRALLAKVDAPADFVEEELKRWRARGLITREPADLLEEFLEKEARAFAEDYWDDIYDGAFDLSLAALKRGIEIAQDKRPTPLELEKVIIETMNSGNDITAYEITLAVRERFTNLVKD